MSRDIDGKLVRKLARLLEETGLGELEYASGDWRIRVVRPQASAVVQAAAPPVAAAGPAGPDAAGTATAPPTGPAAAPAPAPGTVKSPMVGTVYVAADPTSPPFVSVGASVAAGETVLIVEAMKVMNPITAPIAGTVREILVTNGQPVEFDQPLLIIA